MGWSCTKKQSEALERLHQWEHAQQGWYEGENGAFWFEFIPDGKDYGTAKYPNMKVHVWQFGSLPHPMRPIEIRPDGSYDHLPAGIKFFQEVK